MEKIGGYIAAIRNLGQNCWGIDYESYVASYSVTTPSISKLRIQ